jgi:hypothetical protein
MAVAESEIVARAQALLAAFTGRDWDAYFADVTRTRSRFRVRGPSKQASRQLQGQAAAGRPRDPPAAHHAAGGTMRVLDGKGIAMTPIIESA